MSDYTWNHLNHWKYLPLQTVTIKFLGGDTHTLGNLTKGSTVEIKPVFATKKAKAGNHNVAYRLSSKLIVSQSYLRTMAPLVDALNNTSLEFIQFGFGWDDSMSFDLQTTADFIKDISASLELAYNENIVSPELTINLAILLTRDIYDLTNFQNFITQSWSL